EENFAANAGAHLLLNQRADLLAAGIGADANASRHGRHEDDREERECADDDNEVATLHRVKSRARSRRLERASDTRFSARAVGTTSRNLSRLGAAELRRGTRD